ncbi:hypothetical protein A3E39_00920 [Candidatus Uhrbacteria bacterium RIFCSPHIGHO2_12_FULL_60_25]|uniref:Glycerophosphoryl diester phosphodiesterase membrane domain-containing protein n=1 Tax=Candidatus Uhrbacteria bacterium RIFCSPHIGHO2_12_FULL_60_25 TaxID=1802399 RepID=A0A1F7UN45_9BACT|nr:MAG: hypothetical protein A3D73_02880 [Candidatus Uhrbacteria bacterium RIFCSPHIGHO2_02_FULL_60_44]OGL79665.1 MAG: hypothetical protein A3E39_00920 [Candidatus Uhrbacteria bacterium RIFCSPHIGHO2_12_FULL_60_25]
MPAPLTSAGALIKDSWQLFVKTWDTTVRYSAWLIIPAVLTLADLAIPGNQESLIVLSAVVQIAVAIAVAIWVSIVLYQVTLALDAGSKVTEKTTADWKAFVLPMVLIGALQGLATLGALLLFVLPGIYVGVRLGFSQLTLFSKGLKGRAALAESWTLTKNRFWAVFWRQIAAGFVFAVLIMIVTTAAVLLVGLVAGGSKLGVLVDSKSLSPVAGGILGLVQSIIQAAFIPLIVIFQVKLYRALDRTRA